MYQIQLSNKCKRDIRKCARQNKNMEKFRKISLLLEAGKALPSSNSDHILTGNWQRHRECHIEPDWLLIYCVDEDTKIIEFVRMGSHSDLF